MNLRFEANFFDVKKRIRISPFRKIILGFAGVILLAALILMLPISSAEGKVTPFLDTLFTATSATCVTGLIVHDTATYWSVFGQGVILILIQIGGMGVITLGSIFVMAAHKKISLAQRSAMQESINAQEMGSVVGFTGFLLKGMVIIELSGAVLLMPVMIMDFGVKGIWYAFFHSISAFCNAGFDLMGIREQYSSLTAYTGNIYVNTVIMLLIITGGIGFLTWRDVCTHGIHFSRYRLQTKIVLVTTAILLFLPAIFYYVNDLALSAFDGMSTTEKVLAALFQSVTARTAGFNTIDLAQMSHAGLTIMIILMLIGGSPGSTAGGMKTTTIAVLVMSMIAVFKQKENTDCFGRRIEDDTVKHAAAIFMMYIILFMAGTLVISMNEDIPFLTCMFEAASAIGTVGVTLGVTPGLGTVSHIVLILLMFLGRVGGLTLIYATVASVRNYDYKLPKEKIMVG